MAISMNRKLNLVIPVELTSGATIYVHSTPISLEVFESFYKVIALTFTKIYSGGFTYASGPRIAKLLLKEAAQSLGSWDGPNGVQAGLIAEINRITNVIIPKDNGWTTIPLEDALKRNIMEADDVSEVENAIVFFIVASAMHHKTELKGILEAAAGLWGSQCSLLNSTEFKDSLPTLTATENIGENATPVPKEETPKALLIAY